MKTPKLTPAQEQIAVALRLLECLREEWRAKALELREAHTPARDVSAACYEVALEDTDPIFAALLRAWHGPELDELRTNLERRP